MWRGLEGWSLLGSFYSSSEQFLYITSFRLRKKGESGGGTFYNQDCTQHILFALIIHKSFKFNFKVRNPQYWSMKSAILKSEIRNIEARNSQYWSLKSAILKSEIRYIEARNSQYWSLKSAILKPEIRNIEVWNPQYLSLKSAMLNVKNPKQSL